MPCWQWPERPRQAVGVLLPTLLRRHVQEQAEEEEAEAGAEKAQGSCAGATLTYPCS